MPAGPRITVERSSGPSPVMSYRTLELQLVSHDRPGIVRDVTEALNQLGANIEEFSTGVESAPFTGETMFRATARLHVPDDVTREEVQTTLERLADEMMVDLTTNADGGSDPSPYAPSVRQSRAVLPRFAPRRQKNVSKVP